MSEKRKTERITLNSQIDIIDLASGDVLGQLVNISDSGFMLHTSQPLQVNKLFQLQLSFMDTELADIDCGAESLWEQELTPQSSYWYGFQIIDISNKNADVLKALTERWAS